MIPRSMISLVAAVAFAAPAFAQPQPGQPQPGQSQPSHGQHQPRPPQGPMGPRHAPAGVNVDRVGHGDVPQQLRVIHGYLGLVQQFSTLAQDPAASGVAAVLSATEILKPRGGDAMIEFFTELLPQVKNEAVRRTIRIQLVEAYKMSNQHDKALAELQTLITETPPEKE